ncbi:MAG: hypothetical protein V4857_05935, partial [Pseudomonadota bacterium]
CWFEFERLVMSRFLPSHAAHFKFCDNLVREDDVGLSYWSLVMSRFMPNRAAHFSFATASLAGPRLLT